MHNKNNSLNILTNILKGKTLYIIANGPSLANTNLELIKNENSIAMNRINLIYKKFKKWRPTYYLFASTNINNPIWGNNWKQSILENTENKNITSIIDGSVMEALKLNKNQANILRIDNIVETKPSKFGQFSKNIFSTDPIIEINKSGSSINIAFQLAFLMKPKVIIILGADLDWKNEIRAKYDRNHFDNNYLANIPDPTKANIQMREVHRQAKIAFDLYLPETKIYNASLQTKLDIWPIINYEEYINKKKIVYEDIKMNEARLFWENLKYENQLIIYLRRKIFRIREKTNIMLLLIDKFIKILRSGKNND